jgi:hypothetical protein
MNAEHHEQIVLDTLKGLRLLGDARKPIIAAALSERAYCRELLQAASAPDRLREVSIPAVKTFGDEHVFAGNNAASFCHFEAYTPGAASPRPGPLNGYCWIEDIGTSWASATLLKVMDTAPEYSPENFGERAPGYPLITPMGIAASMQPKSKLAYYRFPSATAMAEHFATLARRYWRQKDYANWRLCVGYVLHFLADVCVPHHIWGTLFLGHSDWEKECEAHWLKHQQMLRLAEQDEYLNSVLPAIDAEIPKNVDSILELMKVTVLKTRIRFGTPRDIEECPLNNAMRVSVTAIAASVKAIEILSRP